MDPHHPHESVLHGKAVAGLHLAFVFSLCFSPSYPLSSLSYPCRLFSCLSSLPALFSPQNLAPSNFLPCLLLLGKYIYVSHFDISEIGISLIINDVLDYEK